jgi:FdhD protein
MNSKYEVLKLKSKKQENIEDAISIEEPLEMVLKYKKNNEWVSENISITMRTPGNDEDLITGFLFNEKIIENFNQIEKIEKEGEEVGQYNLKNKIVVKINSSENINIGKLRRNFLTNSSCGVCGKTSIDSLEIIKTDKINKTVPKLSYETIIKAPELLRQNQSEFSKTGGIHASGLIDSSGKIIAVREDVGRHNALDKLIGHALKNNLLDSENQFLTCSGRLSFELVQKALMSNIAVLAGVGAPTSLAIDLAKRFDMTLLGFVKKDGFNIYSNKDRIIIKN